MTPPTSPPGPAGPSTPPPSYPPSYPPPGTPYPYPQPPPRSTGLPLVLVVLAIVVIAVVVVGAIVWFFVAPRVFPEQPTVTFSNPYFSVGGAAHFNVTSANFAFPAGSYRVNLEVATVPGTADWLAANTQITVGGETYTITWTDTDGGLTLNANDRFTVMHAGGLPGNTAFRFSLIWVGGSTSGSASWTTPP